MIRDLLFLIAGMAITHLGVLLGIHRERKRKPEPPLEPVALCTCEHYLSSHDPETSRCHETEPGTQKFNPRAGRYEATSRPCSCRQYVGPRPIDTLFQPRTLPVDGVA